MREYKILAVITAVAIALYTIWFYVMYWYIDSLIYG